MPPVIISKPTIRTYLMLPWLLFLALFILWENKYADPYADTIAPSWAGWILLFLFLTGSFSMKIVSFSNNEIVLTKMITRRKKRFATSDIETIRLLTRKSGIIQLMRLMKPTKLVMVKFGGERPDFVHLSSMLNTNVVEIREFLKAHFPDRVVEKDNNLV